MNQDQKLQRLSEFANEREFRLFLIDLLKKMQFKDVTHTHRYGSPELGKDVIATMHHNLEGDEYYAFVVKIGRIGGGSSDMETLKAQVKQAFEYPYQGATGSEIKTNKVKVVTNGNITGGAQTALNQSAELRNYNNIGYWSNEVLIDYIDQFYPDFWLPGDLFVKEYGKAFVAKLNQEIQLRELEIHVDDKQLNRLLQIFIEPKITRTEIEEKDGEGKIIHQRKLTIKALSEIQENMVLSGEQGAGKTRVLNTIACRAASAETIDTSKRIPIRLKAPVVRNAGFTLEREIENEVKALTGQYFDEERFRSHIPVLFIDDMDILVREEKEQLFKAVKEFCHANKTFYVLTYRNTDFSYDKGYALINIHNFDLKRVEMFITKYFEGTDRAGHFIKILKESDLLSRLPTTPLTVTLIALLYDENTFEIPATITDIYSDFTSVLLGKLSVKSKQELLVFNIKRRLFSVFALALLDSTANDVSLDRFKEIINGFLTKRGYAEQSDSELLEIIENSGLLFLDDNDRVGFKQQAFVEFFASIEIYHHARTEYYSKMVSRFNDVRWQNTAIFYAGHSKELEGMIDDVITMTPNASLTDWFINAGGMGYLAQALYQTTPDERKKLVLKAMDNMYASVEALKAMTKDKDSFFENMPLPIICGIVAFWFMQNFKSITLRSTLNLSYDQISAQVDEVVDDELRPNLGLLLIALTLMNEYVKDERCMNDLLERESFISNPLLMLVADMMIDVTSLDSGLLDPSKLERVKKQIHRKREYIKAILKEPAHKINHKLIVVEPERD